MEYWRGQTGSRPEDATPLLPPDAVARQAISDAVTRIASPGEENRAAQLSQRLSDAFTIRQISRFIDRAPGMVGQCRDLDQVAEVADLVSLTGQVLAARQNVGAASDRQILDGLRTLLSHRELASEERFQGLAQQLDGSDAMMVRVLAHCTGMSAANLQATDYYSELHVGRAYAEIEHSTGRESVSFLGTRMAYYVSLAKTPEAREMGLTAVEIEMATRIVGAAVNTDSERYYVAGGDRQICMGADRRNETSDTPHEFGDEPATAIIYRSQHVLEVAQRVKAAVTTPVISKFAAGDDGFITDSVFERFPGYGTDNELSFYVQERLGQMRQMMQACEERATKAAAELQRRYEVKRTDIRDATNLID